MRSLAPGAELIEGMRAPYRRPTSASVLGGIRRRPQTGPPSSSAGPSARRPPPDLLRHRYSPTSGRRRSSAGVGNLLVAPLPGFADPDAARRSRRAAYPARAFREIPSIPKSGSFVSSEAAFRLVPRIGSERPALAPLRRQTPVPGP